MLRKGRSRVHLPFVSLVVLPVLASLLATGSAPGSSVPGVLPDAAADSLMILLPVRGVDAVNQELTSASLLEEASNADLVLARGNLAEAKARVEVCAKEIETVKAKVKLAKEQKNETEQGNLERQVKAKELQHEMLKARKEMREAEVVLAETRRTAAQTQSGCLKKELELIGKRDDLLRASSAVPGPTNMDAIVRLQTEIRDLERRCLEIQKEVAEKDRKCAEDEANLLDKRLKLREAQLAFVAGPKK